MLKKPPFNLVKQPVTVAPNPDRDGCTATYRHTRMLRVRNPSVRRPIVSLAPKLCARACVNTAPCVRQHCLPRLRVTVTSVPVTDPTAVVDPTRELLSEYLRGSDTGLHVTNTSVPVTDLSLALVDPTWELLLGWFLSVDSCGSGTDLISLFFCLI